MQEKFKNSPTVVIDTSSLLACTRYYFPFDKNKNGIIDLLNAGIQTKKIIILDKIFNECNRVANKIIINAFNWHNIKPYIIKVTDKNDNLNIPIPQDFLDKCDLSKYDNEVYHNIPKQNILSLEDKKRLYEKYIKSVDLALIMYSEVILSKKCLLVTEETIHSNDNKNYKKIPLICNERQISYTTLPQLLQETYKIKLPTYLQE